MNEDKEKQFKNYGDEIRDRMMFKARKGDIEHKDDFNKMTPRQLMEELLDEVADLVNFALRLRDIIIKDSQDPPKSG